MDRLDELSQIRSFCPNANAKNCNITSMATAAYNCVGWAMRDDKRWWEPLPGTSYYWPTNCDSDYSVESYIGMFSRQGFEVCADGICEDGFEKIAIYEKDGEFTHVALQTPSGRWSSKLGALEDVEHDTPGVLEGDDYGTVRRFMRRRSTDARLF